MVYRRITADDLGIAYPEGGPSDAPVLPLLHGYPSTSDMFRDLIPGLADRFRIVALASRKPTGPP
jgi:pimeloyl-ACP methyl ester carboxylesterase